MTPNRVEILGIPICSVTPDNVLSLIRQRVTQRQAAHIVTVNAEYVMLARKNPSFASVLRRATLQTPDSTLTVWAVRRRGLSQDERVGGSDLIWSIAEQCAENGHRLFLLGGGPRVAETAGHRLRVRYPGLQIAGTYAGSPSLDEEAFIVDLIRRARTDVLLVAFGAPSQDLWIARNLERTGSCVGMGVGGSFDYVAGSARRAPVWMQEHGLEWFWRLMRQPWRWKRMLALPQFVWLVLREDRGMRGRVNT